MPHVIKESVYTYLKSSNRYYIRVWDESYADPPSIYGRTSEGKRLHIFEYNDGTSTYLYRDDTTCNIIPELTPELTLFMLKCQ